ncbi:hypothetical protein BT93_B0462 [Corymbia citriodora subsp. variegata]|nr:hypothetical protein BT93_B0462 [Corymbia citriodora subsp. variegata]
MVLKVASQMSGDLSPSDYASDPEDKEFSDDDDDDRNHKHRRRETRSQSSEKDALEHNMARSYRKHNKPFDNGHMFRENETQDGQSWKNYNAVSSERDFSTKFEKRHPGSVSLPRGPLDLNPRARTNQTFSGNSGPGRGRGRDSGAWNHRDARFNSVDIASQVMQRGSIRPSLFPGRGLPGASNAQNASWGAYGLIPGVPSGGLDALSSVGLQGAFRPPISTSLGMGIPRQRCRDFEERGFCLRGDMCPMEHGVNRIVVEDVQSLSQFNLPVSLPSAHLLGTPALPGPVPSGSASSTSLMNSKGPQGKSGKHGMSDDSLVLNSAYSAAANVVGADLYDPDQPLWSNNGPEGSSLLALHSSQADETESPFNHGISDRHVKKAADIGHQDRGAGLSVASQNPTSSVWGRIRSSKVKMNSKGETDAKSSTSDLVRDEMKEKQEASANVIGSSHRGKQIAGEDKSSKAIDTSQKTQSDAMRFVRKPTQKATRTLFVNCIPQKSNKREALLSHFQKFGEIIDIYIPTNSERAFVQFSKREEAEAALKAPDAVMGNRFIKLWWANRDSIPDDGISSVSGASLTPHSGIAGSVPTAQSIANRKDNIQSTPLKAIDIPVAESTLPSSDQSKPLTPNGSKVTPPLQKKLESLEQLKEQLRKKREMLDRKRNDFKRQLDKLEKQASGVKGEVIAEQAAKRQKLGLGADAAKAVTPRSSDVAAVTERSSATADAMASSNDEVMDNENKLVEGGTQGSRDTSSLTSTEGSSSMNQLNLSLTAAGFPFIHRYKLDNRPTTFKILPPLPIGFASVSALKKHFSSFGDLAILELEDVEGQDDINGSETLKTVSAHIGFVTRDSAERAFANGKCWQGHNLQFVWLSTMSSNDTRDQRSSARAEPSTIHSAGKESHVSLQDTGNGDAENSERQGDDENIDAAEVSWPNPPLGSAEEGSQESPER